MPTIVQWRVTTRSRVAVATLRLTVVIGAAMSLAATWISPSGASAAACPNASMREGRSAGLPDCRAFELVSPDANHIAMRAVKGSRSSSNGNVMVYRANDAPDDAHSAQALTNLVKATRDARTGWSGASLSPPLSAPITNYCTKCQTALSQDLSSTVVLNDQPLSGPSTPTGLNVFLRRGDTGYRLLTDVGVPLNLFSRLYGGDAAYAGGNADFSQVYFVAGVRQLVSDPLSANNTYSWSEARGLQLLGVLPNGAAAPNGAHLAEGIIGAVSADGTRAVFTADDELYLHTDGEPSVLVGQASIDPTQPTLSDSAGITADGTTVLFTSRSELTGDANTGPAHAGRDLYRYDVQSGVLTDLTVDTDPADAATGAGVDRVVSATRDGSYVYFTAAGNLANGGVPGQASLYLWHNGSISFIADAAGLVGSAAYTTPEGKDIVFASTDRLTAYDNRDPVSGQPHVEVYKATIGKAVECVSCRADGTRPAADSALPSGTIGAIRLMSDDGRRVFFESYDAVVPQASIGRRRVYEYSDGRAAAISPADSSTESVFLDSSVDGNDVFFITNDELVPNPNGGDDAVYDARVDGGFPVSQTDETCSGIGCHASSDAVPALPGAASTNITSDGNAEVVPPVRIGKLSVTKPRKIVGAVGKLKVKVPGRGRLTISGAGLQTKRSRSTRTQNLMVTLSLTVRARKSLAKHHLLRTTAKVAFAAADGHASKATVSVVFTTPAARKERS